jgi:hypothetical protein
MHLFVSFFAGRPGASSCTRLHACRAAGPRLVVKKNRGLRTEGPRREAGRPEKATRE